MEKRIGTALIVIEKQEVVQSLNNVLSKHSDIILGRQGISLKDRNIAIISIVLEGTTDEIGSLTGKIGRLDGAKVKSILVKN